MQKVLYNSYQIVKHKTIVINKICIIAALKNGMPIAR